MQKPPWRNVKTSGSLFSLKIHGGRAMQSCEAHATCKLWLCYPALLICSVFCILFHGFSSKRETRWWDCLQYSLYRKVKPNLIDAHLLAHSSCIAVGMPFFLSYFALRDLSAVRGNWDEIDQQKIRLPMKVQCLLSKCP